MLDLKDQLDQGERLEHRELKDTRVPRYAVELAK